MRRVALHLGAWLSALVPCAHALAHGEPPAAFSVLSHDAQGARAVRLSAGAALRRAAHRYQFVCPAAWGDKYAAPLAALADGTLVVGATSGLKLLSEDGTVRAHPDPGAIGDSDEVVRSARGVFSLRASALGNELRAVDAQTARVLWKDSKSLYSMAALDDKLVLLRANGTTVEQVTIAAADGAELERQVAPLGSPVDYAYARVAGGAAYAMVVLRTTSVLGTLSMNTFDKLAEAELTIAGPLKAGEGTLLALDGKLSQLLDGAARPLTESGNVQCLAESEGLSYACDPNGIAGVKGQALGEPLFQFSWLVAPNLELLAAGVPHDDCNAQWQDLRIDLQMAGITLLDESTPDAGSAPIDAGAVSMVGTVPDGGGAAQPIGSADSGAASAAVIREHEGSSCSVRPGAGRAASGNFFASLSALLLVGRRRRSRPGLLEVMAVRVRSHTDHHR